MRLHKCNLPTFKEQNMTQHNVERLERPSVPLGMRQEGNFIIFSVDVPPKTGSVSQAPFLEVLRENAGKSRDVANNAFLESLNGSGLVLGTITAGTSGTSSQGVSGSVSGKLPKLANGEVAVQVNTQVTTNANGSIGFRDGRIGDAINAAQSAYRNFTEEECNKRAYDWAKSSNGVTVPNAATGDTYRVTPGVAKEFHNNRFWPLDPRRVDSGQDSPSATIASGNTNNLTGTRFENQTGQIVSALGRANLPQTDDTVAAFYESARNGKLNLGQPINLVASDKDPNTFFPTQNLSSGVNLRGEGVNPSNIQPGSGNRVFDELARQNNTPQPEVATTPNPEQRAPRGIGMA
jgi:hypothetical protein